MSEINLVAKRGDDEEYELAITVSGGGPFDLDGCEVVFSAKRQFVDPDSDAVIRKTIGDGIEVTNEAGGLATLKLAAADTAGLVINDVRGLVLRYDVQVTDSDDLIVTPIEGRLTIRPDVTLG